MNAWRFVLGVVVFASVLSACTSTAWQLDALTQVEASPARQRAMRRLNLASAYFEVNQNDVAQQEARAALQIDPQYAEAYSLLGLIHQRANAADLAQQSFERAMTLASQPPIHPSELAAIAHNYGWFLCSQNHFEQAQAQFDLALAQPGYARAPTTRQAVELCKIRSAAQASAQDRNN